MKESGKESDLNIFWIWKESINIIFLFKFIRSLTRRKDNCIQDVIVRIRERVKNKYVKKFWKNCISSVRMFNSKIFHLGIFFLRSRTSVNLKDFCKKKKKRTPKSRLSLILSGRESPWKWSTLQTRFSSVTVRIYLYGPG